MSAETFPSQVVAAQTPVVDQSAVIQNLRKDLSRFRCTERLDAYQQVVSTGISALDNILPGQGLRRGWLCEWIAAGPGSGTVSLAMRTAGQAQLGGPLIIVDHQKRFYPPAFSAAGVTLENTILVRPKSHGDALWAIEQSLRCPGVGAVMCRIDHLNTQEFRRLQLATETGTAVGLLIRPASAQRQSGWADVRLLVSPRPSLPRSFHRRLEVRCVYAKGAMTEQTVELELSDETNTVRVATQLSNSTPALRATET